MKHVMTFENITLGYKIDDYILIDRDMINYSINKIKNVGSIPSNKNIAKII
jgi:hypothetical protein